MRWDRGVLLITQTHGGNEMRVSGNVLGAFKINKENTAKNCGPHREDQQVPSNATARNYPQAQRPVIIGQRCTREIKVNVLSLSACSASLVLSQTPRLDACFQVDRYAGVREHRILFTISSQEKRSFHLPATSS